MEPLGPLEEIRLLCFYQLALSVGRESEFSWWELTGGERRETDIMLLWRDWSKETQRGEFQRLTEWVRLEWTIGIPSGDHLVQPPCLSRVC